MGFQYDATGVEVKEFTGFEPLPENTYDLQITDFKEQLTKNGDQMVNITTEVVDSLGGFNGRRIWHNVTFFPPKAKAAGIAIHFLKCIGQPWEGKLNVDPNNWIGKRFHGKVVIESYVAKDGKTKQKNSISFVEPYSGNYPQKEEEVPF